MPLDPAAMTARQLDRRRRAIAAVHELIAEGGVRDLQVKEIADHAGISLAALYRYFSSKEHLLAEALLDWAQGLTARPSPFPTLIRRGLGAYRRAPQYAELYFEVAAARDPYAVACFRQLGDGVSAAMRDALTGVEPTRAADIVRVVGSAWLGGLFDSVHRGADLAELSQSLERLCAALVTAVPGGGGPGGSHPGRCAP